MIRIALILSILISQVVANAQNKFLKITTDEKEEIYFPPKTKFELKNKYGAIVYSNFEESDYYEISEPSVLIVYPIWKTSTVTFQISEGKVELLKTEVLNEEMHETDKASTYTYRKEDCTKGVTLERKLIPIENQNGFMRYDVEMLFSNGLKAKIVDGQLSAFKDNKRLKQKDNYQIYLEDGNIKISFNQKTLKIWWVYDKH